MKATKRIILENRILLSVNFFVFCFLCGIALNEYREINIGIFGYILSVITNHYYVLYCMLPTILIIIAKYIRGQRDIETIRFKSFFHQIGSSIKSFTIWMLLYISTHFTIAFFIGIQVFKSSNYQAIVDDSFYNELVIVLNMYSQHFYYLAFAVVLVAIYFMFGFVVLFSLTSYVNYKYGYKKMIIASVLIYILTFIGFKTELKSTLPILCFNNYILLHHGLFVNGVLKFTLVLITGLLILLVCSGKRITNRSGYKTSYLFVSKKENIISFIIVLSMFLIEVLRNLGNESFSMKDVPVLVMLGTGGGYSSFISWFRMTIIYMAPLFFIGVVDSRIKTYGQAPVLIRMKSKLEFDYKLTVEYIKYIFKYTLYMTLVGNVFYFLGFYMNQGDNYLNELLGLQITNLKLNLYFVIFFVYLIFDFLIFKIISDYTSGVVAFVSILIAKFILFVVPSSNYFTFNFGIIDFCNNLKQQKTLIKILPLLFFIVIYFIVFSRKRYKYVNHRN